MEQKRFSQQVMVQWPKTDLRQPGQESLKPTPTLCCLSCLSKFQQDLQVQLALSARPEPAEGISKSAHHVTLREKSLSATVSLRFWGLGHVINE